MAVFVFSLLFPVLSYSVLVAPYPAHSLLGRGRGEPEGRDMYRKSTAPSSVRRFYVLPFYSAGGRTLEAMFTVVLNLPECCRLQGALPKLRDAWVGATPQGLYCLLDFAQPRQDTLWSAVCWYPADQLNAACFFCCQSSGSSSCVVSYTAL